MGPRAPEVPGTPVPHPKSGRRAGGAAGVCTQKFGRDRSPAGHVHTARSALTGRDGRPPGTRAAESAGGVPAGAARAAKFSQVSGSRGRTGAAPFRAGLRFGLSHSQGLGSQPDPPRLPRSSERSRGLGRGRGTGDSPGRRGLGPGLTPRGPRAPAPRRDGSCRRQLADRGRGSGAGRRRPRGPGRPHAQRRPSEGPAGAAAATRRVQPAALRAPAAGYFLYRGERAGFQEEAGLGGQRVFVESRPAAARGPEPARGRTETRGRAPGAGPGAGGAGRPSAGAASARLGLQLRPGRLPERRAGRETRRSVPNLAKGRVGRRALLAAARHGRGLAGGEARSSAQGIRGTRSPQIAQDQPQSRHRAPPPHP